MDSDIDDSALLQVLKVAEEAFIPSNAPLVPSYPSSANIDVSLPQLENVPAKDRNTKLLSSPSKTNEKNIRGTKAIKASEECRFLSFGTDILWDRVAVLLNYAVV